MVGALGGFADAERFEPRELNLLDSGNALHDGNDLTGEDALTEGEIIGVEKAQGAIRQDAIAQSLQDCRFDVRPLEIRQDADGQGKIQRNVLGKLYLEVMTHPAVRFQILE